MKQKQKKRRAGALARGLCLLLAAGALLLAGPALGASAQSLPGNGTGTAAPTERKMLCPGGTAFGVKCQTTGVLVVGISGIVSGGREVKPAYEAGIRVKDLLLSVDGKEIKGIKDFSDRVGSCEGKSLSVELLREGKKRQVSLSPVRDDADGKLKSGMWLRDSTAGIGTVTFVDPATGAFGGLGHGICDIDTGELMPLREGSAMKVSVGGVVRGIAGKPGELKGYFLPERSGNVMSNTVCGVFGVFTEMPPDLSGAVEVAYRDEVKEGKAQIYCTLGGDGIQCYEIEISRIDRDGKGNKNFAVTVTDPKLKERTGGIVQGMSGSPILQNGRLVGAVTHVMVNDPTAGYGIFIENMLNAMPELTGG